MRRIVAFLPLVLALGACNTTGAGTGSVANAPSMPDIKATILANKSRLWKDPDSVRDVSLSEPSRYLGMGWKVCMRSNGKNSYGGYTGIKAHTVMIYDNGAPPLRQEPVIYDNCDGQTYTNFPEIDAGYKPPGAAKG